MPGEIQVKRQNADCRRQIEIRTATKFPVILSEAKDLHLRDFTMFGELQILRFAQDDTEYSLTFPRGM